MASEQELSSNHVFQPMHDDESRGGGGSASLQPSYYPGGESTGKPVATTQPNVNFDGDDLGQGLLAPEQMEADVDPDLRSKLDMNAEEEAQIPEPDRQVKTSLSKAAFNIFKGNVGAGVFLLPTAYTDSGYTIGPIFAILCGSMVIDCSLMLLRAKTKIGRKDVQTYPQVARFVFGDVMLMIVNAMLIMTQLGFVLLYLQFSAGVFENLVEFNQAYRIFVLLGALIVTPMTFLTDKMDKLAVASMIATFGVFYCIFTTFGYSADKVATDPVKCIEPIETPDKWVLFFASQMTVLEGIGIVLPVENAVKEKEKFPRLLQITLASIVVVYLVYGMTGYFAYGDSLGTSSLVQILDKNPFTATIRIALAAELLLTAPLQFVPAIQIIDKAMKVEAHRIRQSSRAIASRLGIMIVLTLLGMMIGPDTLGLILAFIGSIAATFIAVILPGLLELQTDHAADHPNVPRSGKSYFRSLWAGGCSFRRARAYIYVVVGLVIMIVGTVTCVFDATKLFGHKVGNGHRGLGKNSTAPTSSGINC